MNKFTLILMAIFITPLIGYSQFVENKGQVLDFNENFHPEVKYYHSTNSAGVYFQNDRVVYNFIKVDKVDKNLYSSNQKEYKEALKKREATYYRMDLVFQNANPNIGITTGEESQGVTHFYLNKRNGIRDVKTFKSIQYNNVYPNIDIIFHTSERGMKYDIVLKEGANIKDIQLKFEGFDVRIEDKKLVIPSEFGDITEEIPLSFINDDHEDKVDVEYIINKDGTVGFELKSDASYSKLTIDPVLEWATYFNQVVDPSGFSNTLDYISNHMDADGNYYSYGQGYSSAGNYPVVNPGGAYTANYNSSSDLYIVKFNTSRELIWGTYLGGSSSDETSWGRPITTNGNTLHIVGEGISTGAPFTNGGGFYQNNNNQSFWARFNRSTGALEHLTSYGKMYNPSISISNTGKVAIIGDTYDSGGIPITNRAGAYNQPVNGGYKDMALLMFNASYNITWGTYLGGPSSQEGFTCAFDSNENLYFAGVTGWFGGTTNPSTPTNEKLVTLSGAYNQNVYGGGSDVTFGKFSSSGQLVWHSLYGGNGGDARIGAMGSPAIVTISPTTDELILAFNTTSTNLPVQNLSGAYNKGLPSDPDFGDGGSFWNYAGYIAKFSTAGVRNWGTYFYGDTNESGTIIQNIIFGGCNKFYVGAAGSANTLTGASSGYNLLNSTTGSRNGYITMLDASNFSFEWDSYLNSDHAIDCYVAANINQPRFFATSPIYYENIPVVDPGGGAFFDGNSWDPTKGTLGIFQFHPSLPPDLTDQSICAGQSVTLTASAGMGAPYNWYSSPTGGSSINTGATYTVSPTSTTTYYVSSGTGMCASPRSPITVNVTPAPTAPVISSNSPICVGGTLNLTANTISGATYNWTGPNSYSSSAEDPTRSPVTAAMAGTYNSYVVVAGCTSAVASTNVTINIPSVAPTSITGTSTICSGASTTLTFSGGSAGTGANAQWFSGSCGGTPAGTGNSITVSPTSTTTYFVRYSGTCNTTSCASQTVTVTAPPNAGTLSGNQNVCEGSTTTFSSSVSGGTWSSSNTATATVNSSGVVTGQAAGTTTITYTVAGTGGCADATATRTVTVTAPPNAGTLSGNQNVCEGSTTTFLSSVSGGTWSSSNTSTATVNSSGVVTGQAAGTTTITYTVAGTGGCADATATRTVTVTAPPNTGTLSGNQNVCEGSTTTFSSSVSGGTWSSSNTATATVNSSGVVTGQAAGTATITYTVTGTGGCSDATATRTVTVTAPPNAGTLSGTQAICEGSTTTFSSTSSGGTWSSSNTGTATVNSSGVVTGQAAGTATITYTVTGTGGCSDATATRTVTVTAPPNAGTLSGTQTVCEGSTTTFSTTSSGGTWSSSNMAIATVDGSGVITGLTDGTATITYTVTGTGGCSDATATRTVTVDPLPTVTIPSSGILCEGATLNVTPATGGTWASSDVSVATITNGGVVTGVSEGTADMVFTSTSTGCSSTPGDGTITVNPLPTFTVALTDPSSCGATDGNITISGLNTSTSYDVSIASGALNTQTSNAAGEIVLSGLGAGGYSPIEVVLNGCSTIDNTVYDLNDPSSPTITVPSGGIICEGETLNLLPSTGGTWSSSNPSVATIDNAGLLTGISAGNTTVIYTETASGCSSMAAAGSITVNPTPSVTLPSGGNVCEGATLNLSPSTGGTWSSSDASVASVTNAGVVTGIAQGTAVMTFTNTTTGCTSSAAAGTITVNPIPTITVPTDNLICEGASLNLEPSIGGTWSSNDVSIATITNNGVVTGVNQGTTEMIFTNTATGCSSIASAGTVNVNAGPILTIGEIVCNKPKVSYSVGYTTNAGATVSASIGNITNTAITDIPNNQQVIITATTDGCPSISETVFTNECIEVIIDISNGVSPNNDGLNDFFTVTNLDAYPNNKLMIFNRWGDQVYESGPYENDWNGQNNTGGIGGEELPAGTYFYILELDDDQDPIKGYIELKK